MSLKNSKNCNSETNQKKQKKTLSITSRFTFLYVISVLILLVFAAGFLYWTLKQNLELSRRGLLKTKVEIIRKLLYDQPQSYQALVNEIEHEADSSYPIKYYIRIIDAEGKILTQTPEFGKIVPVTMFPEPATDDNLIFNNINRTVFNTQSFLLLSGYASTRQTTKHYVFQIAADVTNGDSILSDYSRKLTFILIFGLIASTFVGWWLARKGVQPLIDITKNVRHITANNLNQRIIVSSWPSELTEMAAAFNSMLDRLQDSFTRLSQFSSDIAHELRTPINNLRGETEVALSRCRTPEEYQKVLYSCLDEYQRISRMIESLLFLARADNPNSVIYRTSFDARDEIQSVCDFYEAVAAEQNININIYGNSQIYADQELFRRVINNLLDNALRHTPEGGKIDFFISNINNTEVEIKICDTGEGIHPKDLPRIFERFYRTDSSRLSGKTGAGLGLAIVKSIMNLHKGSVNIESQPGKGTTVILKFPSAQSGNIETSTQIRQRSAIITKM
ncbi:MAG: heavy metal sensor histidine kinase [Verrucomicrobiia bacterium]